MAEAGIDPIYCNRCNRCDRHRLRPDFMYVEMGNNERMTYKAVKTAALELTSTIR